MHLLRSLVLLVLCSTAVAAEPPAQVLIVGTFHFGNPGRDQHNVEAVDVMTPERQAQIDAVVDGLARFKPDMVAVEWPADVTTERYAAYRAGTLDPSRNEVVQLGFRLAAKQGLDAVHGIDVDGDFPYEPLQAFAQAHGLEAKLDAAQQEVGVMVAAMDKLQRESTIGAALRYMNLPSTIDAGQAFYAQALRYGDGADQPGAALNAAWAARNYGICARLMQALKPGARAVVFYGQGHVHLLQRCVIDMPGVELVQAGDYLPGAH